MGKVITTVTVPPAGTLLTVNAVIPSGKDWDGFPVWFRLGSVSGRLMTPRKEVPAFPEVSSMMDPLPVTDA